MAKKNIKKNEIELIEEIYREFTDKLKKISAERDKNIHEAMKRIEARQIDNIRKSL
jgi:hypothetical protein